MLKTLSDLIQLAGFLHGATGAFVDRVEADYRPIAVVCVGESCTNVRTTARKGGLVEGLQIKAVR